MSYREEDRMRHLGKLGICLWAALAVSGCARVNPWERDLLSRPAMKFDSEQDESVLDHTFYNAREGAAGGFESGGGGCGCN
jgi:hypothetical protein